MGGLFVPLGAFGKLTRMPRISRIFQARRFFFLPPRRRSGEGQGEGLFVGITPPVRYSFLHKLLGFHGSIDRVIVSRKLPIEYFIGKTIQDNEERD